MSGVPRVPALQTGSAAGVGASVALLGNGDALVLGVLFGAVSVAPHPAHNPIVIAMANRSDVRLLQPRSTIANVYRGRDRAESFANSSING